MVDEHRPAGGPDQPRYGHAPAVGAKLVAALSAAHAVRAPAAVELRAACAEAQQRSVAEREGHHSGLLVDAELLDQLAILGLYQDGERIRRELDSQLAAADAFDTHERAHTGGRRSPVVFHQRAVGWDYAVVDRRDGDPDRPRGGWCQGYHHGLCGDLNGA